METNSLKSPLVHRKHLSEEDRKKARSFFIIIIVIVIALGIWYALIFSTHKEAVPIQQRDPRSAEIGELMRATPTSVSQIQIDQIAKLMSKSKTTPSDVDKQAIANLMK